MIFTLQEDGSIRSKRRRLQWQWSNTQVLFKNDTYRIILGGGGGGGGVLGSLGVNLCQYNYMYVTQDYKLH